MPQMSSMMWMILMFFFFFFCVYTWLFYIMLVYFHSCVTV